MDKSLDDLLYQYFLLCQHFHTINVTLYLTEIPVHQLTLPHPLLSCGWLHDHLVRSHDSHMTCHTFLGGFLQLSEVEDEEVGDGSVLFVCHSDFLGRFFRLDLFFLFPPSSVTPFTPGCSSLTPFTSPFTPLPTGSSSTSPTILRGLGNHSI